MKLKRRLELRNKKDKFEALRNITENLPLFPPLDTLNGKRKKDGYGHSYFNVDVEKGNAEFYPLYNCNECAIATYYAEAGTVHGRHYHCGITEYCIVVNGKIKFIYDEYEETFGVKDIVIIKPDTPHSAEFLEDSWVIAITIPQEKGWPNA